MAAVMETPGGLGQAVSLSLPAAAGGSQPGSPAAPAALPRAVPNIWAYLDGETQDLDPHATHVGSCHLPHQLGKLVPVLVDLLHCQGTCRGEEGEALFLEQVTHKNMGLSSATSLLSLILSGLGSRA